MPSRYKLNDFHVIRGFVICLPKALLLVQGGNVWLVFLFTCLLTLLIKKVEGGEILQRQRIQSNKPRGSTVALLYID